MRAGLLPTLGPVRVGRGRPLHVVTQGPRLLVSSPQCSLHSWEDGADGAQGSSGRFHGQT